jgi:hypothetical protein
MLSFAYFDLTVDYTTVTTPIMNLKTTRSAPRKVVPNLAECANKWEFNQFVQFTPTEKTKLNRTVLDAINTAKTYLTDKGQPTDIDTLFFSELNIAEDTYITLVQLNYLVHCLVNGGSSWIPGRRFVSED